MSAHHTASAVVLGVALFLVAACSGKSEEATSPPIVGPAPATPTAQAPERPKLVPIDALAQFREASQHAPTPLIAERAEALGDLIETAWLPGHADRRTAARAAQSLSYEDPDDVVRALEANLNHTNTEVRVQCAWQLAQRGAVIAIPELLAQYRGDVRRRSHVWLTDALWRLGCDECLPTLAANFRHEDVAADAGQSAIARIRRAGLPLSEQPTWQELSERVYQIWDHWRLQGEPLLADPRPTDVPDVHAVTSSDAFLGRLATHMLELPKTELRGVDIARAVIRSMGRMGLPMIRLGLRGQQRYVRYHTLEMVESLGPSMRELGPDVLALMDDPLCRTLAIRTLGKVRYADAYEHVRPLLDSDDAETAVAAAGALGGIGNPDAVEPLRAILADNSRLMDIRIYAAASLTLLVAPQGVPGDAEQSDPGIEFLQQQLEAKTYHEPTVRELIDTAAVNRRLMRRER